MWHSEKENSTVKSPNCSDGYKYKKTNTTFYKFLCLCIMAHKCYFQHGTSYTYLKVSEHHNANLVTKVKTETCIFLNLSTDHHLAFCHILTGFCTWLSAVNSNTYRIPGFNPNSWMHSQPYTKTALVVSFTFLTQFLSSFDSLTFLA